jgi:putative transposase
VLTEIREGLNKGMALGSERFKEEVEALTGRRLKPKKVGRQVGWRKKKPGN